MYYTALLVNVGCHSDAHEQAKWFGDDIKLKSGKYDYEFGSVRAVLATMRLVGAGNPPLHRFRVGLEFAVSGHRQLDGMITQHAKLAQTLAHSLTSRAGARGVGAAYEQWDGRGWPGDLKAEAVPIAARIAQIAEFIEVAHRVGGIERRPHSPAGEQASSSIRRWPRSCPRGGRRYSAAWRRFRPGEP